MKSPFMLTTFLCLLTTLFMFSSCEKEEVRPVGISDQSDIALRGGANGKGKGNGKGNNDGSDDGAGQPDSTVYTATYIIDVPDDYDQLYKFSISESGDLMLLQTDPTITHWGTDFWGSWADPFVYVDGVVHYINGLTEVTYEFAPLDGDRFDVTRTLSVASYNSGNVTTTVTHPGIYVRVE